MLRPQQVRQLVILGFLFVVALSLTFLAPGIIVLMRKAFQVASNPPPPPAVDEAPAPPPSPYPPGTVILGGALNDVQDLTPLLEVDREPAYQKVVWNVASIPVETLEKDAEREIPYATYLKHAPELRGRIFKVVGEAMMEIVPVRLFQQVQDREDVYRIFMTDLGIEAGFVVDLVDRPKGNLEQRDRIEFEGMFYKVVRYQNKRKQDRDAPLLVARSFRRLPPDPETKKSANQFIFELVLGIGIAAILVFAFLLNRKMIRGRTVRSLSGFPRRGPPAGKPGRAPESPAAPPGKPDPPETS